MPISHAIAGTKWASGAALAVALASFGAPLSAQDVSGELVIINWQGGTENEMWNELNAKFMELHPDVTVNELELVTQGDARGAIRTAMMGGEVVDLIINTWPSFRKEMADAGFLQPIDEVWQQMAFDERLDESWKQLGSVDGTAYAVPYVYGNRSGIWYNPKQLAAAGVDGPPATWEDFIASFKPLQAAGHSAPVAIPGKYWAHAEWFETLFVRMNGVEGAAALASHEMAWTDPKVRQVLEAWADMLKADCCGNAAAMLSNDWDGSAAQIFQADAQSYELMGMWMAGMLSGDLGLKEGEDFAMFQFPAMGMGHDDTTIVDAKELVMTANSPNPEAAAAFLDFVLTEPATDIMAKYGFTSPSKTADQSTFGPSQQTAMAAVNDGSVQFVIGDLLPGDLPDEYRVQLQRFLQDPSDETITSVLETIEAKAATLY